MHTRSIHPEQHSYFQARTIFYLGGKLSWPIYEAVTVYSIFDWDSIY